MSNNCTDCLQNCDPLISDRCTRYTGNGIPLLGIQSGDSLFEFENALIAYLETVANGSGVTLDSLTLTCPLITNLLGFLSPTIPNLIQVLITASCNLQTQITAISSAIDPSFSFNTQCLTGSPTTRDQILQAVINLTCATSTAVTAISVDYVKASQLTTLVTNIVNNPDSGIIVQYNSRMVPNAPIPYIGSLSNFDSTGAGLSSAGFAKVYLMNGLNSTQDWRGRSPIGAIQNVPGGTLDSAVDPNLAANAGFNYALNQKIGSSTVTLNTTQIPGHTHPLTDPGHIHGINTSPAPGICVGSQIANSCNANNAIDTKDILLAKTGITIQSAGGGLPHSNVQPSVGCLYIVYIP